MKNGMIETRDGDLLLGIHKEFDLYGNQKRPLTTEEQVLIFAIGKGIKEGKIVSVNGGDEMKHEEIELKSCPFCGRPATTSETENIRNLPYGWGWVGCRLCHVFINWSHGSRGKEMAIEAWNRRVDSGLSGSY